MAHPIVGRCASRPCILPDVAVAFWVLPARSALDEPGMLVRCVVGHKIKDHFEIEGVSLCDQALAIGNRAEERIDVTVIGDVIAEVDHRRWVEWADPDGVNTERCKVGKPPANAVEIAHAVAVRVLKRARIDLVDDRGLPPFGFHRLSPSMGRGSIAYSCLCSHIRSEDQATKERSAMQK